MARDFPGIPFSSLPDPTAPDFTPRLRNILGTIHHWAQDQSNGMARIAAGEVPNGSGGASGGGVLGVTDHGLLTGLADDDHLQYLLLAGRAAGQSLFGGTGPNDLLTIRASSGDIKTRSATFGESGTTFFRAQDLSNYVLPGANGIAGLFDMRHSSAAVYGSTMLQARGTLNGITFWSVFDAALTSMGSVALSGSVASLDAVLVTQRYVTGTTPAINMQLQDSAVFGNSDATCITLNIKQRATQTGSLTQWQNSAGTTVASVSVAGAASVASLTSTGAVSGTTGSFSSVSATGQVSGQFLSAVGTSTSQVGIVVTGAVGQTADLQQWAVSGSGTLALISANGGFTSSGQSRFVDQTVTGPSIACYASPTAAYDGLGLLLDDLSGFKGEFCAPATGFTANRAYRFPDATGDIVVSGSSATIVAGTSSTFASLTASTGASFMDASTNTKRLRFVLSGSVGNNSITVASSAARNYTTQDVSGTVVLVGSAASASGTLGTISLTGQTGSLAAQTLLTGAAVSTGLYRVTFYVKTTTAGDAADNLTATLAWNDGSAQTEVVGFLGGLGTNSNVTPYTAHALDTNNAFSHATLVVRTAASQNITFTTTLTSPGAGTPAYTIDARIEALG